ncbi:putative F-box/LRR-repeat protein-like [Capsicum annuum]|nr:putative F-box/LRR-repeat protein-like [Capsicum annuum]
MFAFTSLGINYDKELVKRNDGIYTFRVQGQMYHFINDLLPADQIARNLKLYFHDTDNEIANRMACSAKVHESIVLKLINILRINPYSIFLKSLIDVPDLSNFYIALNSGSGLDQGVYNLPNTSEVAVIWVEK